MRSRDESRAVGGKESRGFISVPEIVTIVLAAAIAVVCALVLAAALSNPTVPNSGQAQTKYAYIKLFGEEAINSPLSGAPGEADHYLKVKIELKVKQPKQEAVQKAIGEVEPELRARILAYIAGQDAKAIRVAGARQRMTREMLDEINEFLGTVNAEAVVEEVLFTDFIFQ
jgi:flagellar basal body-associated protein FliL